ncbi:MAG TPA: zf-HC2 domain-containing protein [Cellvibrio sp.]|nr:zf-HC2 domain-containing protein [Cellvibrio sp.]
MLSCKNVAHLASDYLDKNMSGTLPWKVRLHLAACSCCRRFVKHLKITKDVVPQLIDNNLSEADAETILKKIKARD